MQHGSNQITTVMRPWPEKETDLQSLLGPPPLLEGEDASTYHALKSRILSAVKPEDAIEGMWVRDILDLLWETVRLRRLKAKLMRATAHQGLQELLRPLVHNSMLPDIGQGWARRDPGTMKAVKDILSRAGLDEEDIAAQTLALGRDTFETIDRMIMQTEARRHVVLREIDRRRDAVARRLRDVSSEVENEEAPAIAPAKWKAAE
jgi:hypothetical protein